MLKLLFNNDYDKSAPNRRAAPKTTLRKKPSKRKFRLGLFGAAATADDDNDEDDEEEENEEEAMEVDGAHLD